MPFFIDVPDSVLERLFSFTELYHHEPVVFMSSCCLCRRALVYLTAFMEKVWAEVLYCRRCHHKIIDDEAWEDEEVVCSCGHVLVGMRHSSRWPLRYRYRLLLAIFLTLSEDDYERHSVFTDS